MSIDPYSLFISKTRRPFLVFTFLILAVISSSGRSYYLSSTEGLDSNAGTMDEPWKTLEKISSVILQPNDTVCFKRGERFDGHFIVKGSGSESQPIVITSYGQGERPIITGEVGEAAGGDYREAIYVENNDHLLFTELEINNERRYTRSGVDSIDAFGIYIYNSGPRILRNFTFRNITFRNVYAVKELENPADFNDIKVAALRFATKGNWITGKEKNTRNILVEDCYFENLQRLGVHITHAGGNTAGGNDSINRNMDLVFRNNEFHNTGGTCILPTSTYNCLIENNLFDRPGAGTDPRMPARGSSVWTWNCHNTVIQHNRCMHIRGYLDSHGIHIDHKNRNTFVQYNYMEDCEGGFVEILGGNINAVYRFNISVNDGWRENPNWKNSNHTLFISEKIGPDEILRSDSSYIYNNTIFIDSAYSTSIDIDANNTFIYNNIFCAVDGGVIGGKQVSINSDGPGLFLSNNLYMGDISSSFTTLSEESNVSGNANFINPEGETAEDFQLGFPGPSINAGLAMPGPGIPGAGSGIFKDIPAYPVKDFFGHPVDLVSGSPNIGACNSKDGRLSSLEEVKAYMAGQNWSFYPNPANRILTLEHKAKSDAQIHVRIFDGLGQLVQTQGHLNKTGPGKYRLELSPELPNGLYILHIDDGDYPVGKQFLILR